MTKQTSNGWKVTAGLAGVGLSAAALLGVSGAGAGTPPERIQLRDTVSPASANAPSGVRAPARTTRTQADRKQSVDGQSVDSPLRDADDSPDTAADSPADSPDGDSVDSPVVAQTSDDSPDDAPRPPAPAADDTPDAPADDSPDAPADDSPDAPADDSADDSADD